MPKSKSTPTTVSAAALDTAFDALRTYASGSSRGALVPIDDAVVASLDDEAARKALEKRLIASLKNGGSPVAVEYLCSKLAMMGSDASVKTLATLLDRQDFATAARKTLEAIPGRQATKALRDSLSKAGGLQKVGVINSLGARRDADSVRALVALLQERDFEIAGAAAAALGDIATARAAEALSAFLSKPPAYSGVAATRFYATGVRAKAADALLQCAERRLAAGARGEAENIYRLLNTPTHPAHVRSAAALGWVRLAGR
jgi:HEAT repeat protein